MTTFWLYPCTALVFQLYSHLFAFCSIELSVVLSMVIWYDSVISPEGELKWQNELNEKNQCFLDACDAIFLNYTWNNDNLRRSYLMSHALSRNHDVFVGIDVFGRNCFGGGGMSCNLAVEEIAKHELSVAIFASGWTHEVLGADHFTRNEYLFWSALGLGVHHWPVSLPLCTSFCQVLHIKCPLLSHFFARDSVSRLIERDE